MKNFQIIPKKYQKRVISRNPYPFIPQNIDIFVWFCHLINMKWPLDNCSDLYSSKLFYKCSKISAINDKSDNGYFWHILAIFCIENCHMITLHIWPSKFLTLKGTYGIKDIKMLILLYCLGPYMDFFWFLKIC